MIYFCDYTKPAEKAMEKHGVNNDDIQQIFNEGMSEGQFRRFIEKDGWHIGIVFHYDGYTLRYVIEGVTKRPLKSKHAANVLARNQGR